MDGWWQVVVDRWEMTVTTGKGRSEKSRVTTFNNYFGIGVDAQVRGSWSRPWRPPQALLLPG